MTNKLRLKRGDVVRRSIAGAKGFFYPDMDGRKIMVRKDCVAEPQVGWHERNNFRAFQVPSDAFSTKDQYDSTQAMVVWIEKNG